MTCRAPDASALEARLADYKAEVAMLRGLVQARKTPWWVRLARLALAAMAGLYLARLFAPEALTLVAALVANLVQAVALMLDARHD